VSFAHFRWVSSETESLWACPSPPLVPDGTATRRQDANVDVAVDFGSWAIYSKVL
jgi:hypothetical protein